MQRQLVERMVREDVLKVHGITLPRAHSDARIAVVVREVRIVIPLARLEREGRLTAFLGFAEVEQQGILPLEARIVRHFCKALRFEEINVRMIVLPYFVAQHIPRLALLGVIDHEHISDTLLEYRKPIVSRVRVDENTAARARVRLFICVFKCFILRVSTHTQRERERRKKRENESARASAVIAPDASIAARVRYTSPICVQVDLACARKRTSP